jgi:hypothetical protein
VIGGRTDYWMGPLHWIAHRLPTEHLARRNSHRKVTRGARGRHLGSRGKAAESLGSPSSSGCHGMSAEAQETMSSSRWPEGIAVVLSITALLVSGYALIVGQRQHQDERTTELLDQIYEDWDLMASPELWEVSHLNEVPETYEHTRDVLRAYASELPIQEQRRLYLLERTTAVRIFNAFELTLNQWRRAVSIGDPDRKEMLDQEVDFYAESFLRNPRLLWLWSEDAGRLSLSFDPPTVEFYQRRVLGDSTKPLTVEPDKDGILPDVDGILGPVSSPGGAP